MAGVLTLLYTRWDYMKSSSHELPVRFHVDH